MTELIYKQTCAGLEIRIVYKDELPTIHTHFQHHYQRGYLLGILKVTDEHPFLSARNHFFKFVVPSKDCTPLTKHLIKSCFVHLEEHEVVMGATTKIAKWEAHTYDLITFTLRSLIDGYERKVAVRIKHWPKMPLLPPPSP